MNKCASTLIASPSGLIHGCPSPSTCTCRPRRQTNRPVFPKEKRREESSLWSYADNGTGGSISATAPQVAASRHCMATASLSRVSLMQVHANHVPCLEWAWWLYRKHRSAARHAAASVCRSPISTHAVACDYGCSSFSVLFALANEAATISGKAIVASA